MSQKAAARLLSSLGPRTWKSDPILVEFVVNPEDHEDGPEWEVIRATGRLRDISNLSESVDMIGGQQALALGRELEPGRYMTTITITGQYFGPPDLGEYDEKVEHTNLERVGP